MIGTMISYIIYFTNIIYQRMNIVQVLSLLGLYFNWPTASTGHSRREGNKKHVFFVSFVTGMHVCREIFWLLSCLSRNVYVLYIYILILFMLIWCMYMYVYYCVLYYVILWVCSQIHYWFLVLFNSVQWRNWFGTARIYFDCWSPWLYSVPSVPRKDMKRQMPETSYPPGTNISHLGKRRVIFKSTCLKGIC